MPSIRAALCASLASLLYLSPAAWAADIPWSGPQFLNEADANGAVREDRAPRAAGAGDGTFIAVWQARTPIGMNPGDNDIFASVSADGGAVWGAPFPLNDAGTDSGEDVAPHIATDGAGTWLVVWSSTADFFGNSGIDGDIAFVLSTDNGATWTDPNYLNDRNVSDGPSDTDEAPFIAYDDGNWICAWQATDGAITGELDGDSDIVYSISANDGATWIPAAPIDAAAGGERAEDTGVSLATDRKGNWVAVWARARLLPGDPGVFDSDILYSRSISGGLSWLPPALATPGDESTARLDFTARVAYGGGAWVIVYSSVTDWTGDSGSDSDLFALRSNNPASGFSPPTLVNDTGQSDSESDFAPSLDSDGLATFVVAYQRSDVSEPMGNMSGSDLYTVVSTDRGVTWKKSVAAGPSPAQDDGQDQEGAAVTDGAGTWTALWSTGNDLTNASGADSDIALIRAAFTGEIVLEGILYDRLTGMGLTCAAIEVMDRETQILAAVATTDRNGYYAVGGIPPGLYRIRMRPVGYPQRIRNLTLGGGEPVTLNEGFAPSDGGVGIFGTVTDADSGAPLPEVKVTATAGARTAITYTCAEGRYEFTLVELFGPGAKGGTEVDLDYEAEGYDPAAATADVPPEGAVSADQTLSKLAGPGTLAGVVLDAAAETPLAGAMVTIGGALNVSDTTDQNGTYLFAALPAGSYSVHASKEGYGGETALVPVPDGAVAARNFVLIEDTGPGISTYDLNGDGFVNAIDIQLVINAALGLNTTVDADVNDDGAADAVDIQLVVNAALGL